MTQVLFAGIGAMGEPMAANLLKKGFKVTVVQNRRSEPAARLAALGARVVMSAAEGAAACDVAILCLPTSREVEAVMLGSGGLAALLPAGAVVLDTTTSDPASTRMLAQQLAARGVGMVDAGLTRGVDGAKKGTLAFFIGGDRAQIDKVQPVLAAMGDTFLHCGPVGHGHTVKVISNVLSYGTVALVNEALMLGGRNGVELGILHQALMQGAPSKALETFGKRIADASYAPARVTVEHVCEDMLLGQKLATSAAAPIFMLGTAQELYRQLDMQGRGLQDMSVLGEVWQSAAKK
jgi:3-hydroxyisobutyrate dehydrogenase-like beta-hydroxyacid dehydrogenase